MGSPRTPNTSHLGFHPRRPSPVLLPPEVRDWAPHRPSQGGGLAGRGAGAPLDHRWATALLTPVDVRDNGVWLERHEGSRKISAHIQTPSPGASLAPCQGLRKCPGVLPPCSASARSLSAKARLAPHAAEREAKDAPFPACVSAQLVLTRAPHTAVPFHAGGVRGAWGPGHAGSLSEPAAGPGGLGSWAKGWVPPGPRQCRWGRSPHRRSALLPRVMSVAQTQTVGDSCPSPQ